MSKFTITIGALTFRPEPYMAFTVGPFELEVDSDKPEALQYTQIREELAQLQRKEFIKQRDLFWEMHKALK